MCKRNERIGMRKLNNFGSEMVVIRYNNINDITVEFPEYNYTTKTTWRHFKDGEIRCPYEPRTYGKGYHGEGKYKTKINKKRTKTYNVWRGMLERCYGKAYQEKHPTYRGCEVCDEWLNFQNFAEWYGENYYEVEGQRTDLDKDILVKGNKIYSPETCIFAPQGINVLFIKRTNDRGGYQIGVIEDKKAKTNKYETSVNGMYIGRFSTSHEAFLAYKFNKELLIQSIAQEYKDKIPTKLYEALMNYQVEEND